MKKKISLILAFIMIFSSVLPVFATDTLTNDSELVENNGKNEDTIDANENFTDGSNSYHGKFDGEFGVSTRKKEVQESNKENIDKKLFEDLNPEEKLKVQTGNDYDSEKEYSFIVSLNTDYFSEFGRNHTGEEIRDDKVKIEQIDFARQANEKALELMKEAGINFNVSNTTEVIMVGFTGTATVENALKLASMEWIEEVTVSPTYEAPSPEEVEKSREDHIRMVTSDKIVNARDLHSLPDAINGKGMVVAILDSGFQVDHPIFYLKQDGKDAAKYKTEQSVANTGITRGAWYNQKIPFMNRYRDNANTPSAMQNNANAHGLHVAGTSVGNETTINFNGANKIFKGLAPEAQLLAMNVFTADGFGIDYKDVLPAIDDAVKLGADSINMSLGSPVGQFSDDKMVGSTYNFTSAIDKASRAGVLVAIAGGNDSQFGYLDGILPKATNPDYGVMGFPAVLEGSFAVASIQNAGNTGEGEMSAFSNWGLGADGNFKPDITAPGGNIISAINGDRYDYMSGTSMASPHVAGGAALIRERLNNDFGDTITAEEKQVLVRNLLMSTAVTHINPFTKTYTSPRHQGAGVMNLLAAYKSNVVLIGDNGQSKIHLKDIDDTFDISFKIKNIGSTPKTYSYKTVLTTNEVKNGTLPYAYSPYYKNELKNNFLTDLVIKDGDMTLNPRLLKEIPGETVTVPAKEEVTITVKVDASEFHNELITQMEEGYFLEGFIVFDAQDPNVDPQLSIPFMGFRGEYNDLKVTEPFINELVKYGKRPHYYHPELDYGFNGNVYKKVQDQYGRYVDNPQFNGSYTHLSSLIGDRYFILGMLPEVDFNNHTVYTDKLDYKNPKFVTPTISPNSDNLVDKFFIVNTLLRNGEGYNIDIYKYQNGVKSELPERNLVNFVGKNNKCAAGTTYPLTAYSEQGMEFDGAYMEDGKYSVDLTTKAVMVGAKEQVESQDFYIDTTTPEPINLKLENGYLTFDIKDLTGIQLEEVYVNNGRSWELVRKTEKGYPISEGITLDKIGIKLMDYGYNLVEATADKATKKEEMNGSITFKESVLPTSEQIPTYSYEIKDSQGNIMPTNTNLPYGKYQVSIKDIQEGYELINVDSITIDISSGDPKQVIDLRFEAPARIAAPAIEKKGQTVSVGILNKLSKSVELKSNAPGATVTIIYDNVEVISNSPVGIIDISNLTLERGKVFKFIFNADGYKEARIIKTIRR